MTSLVFPDINVWFALTINGHTHAPAAWEWYRSEPDEIALVFCRFTQLGLMRLLTTAAAMGGKPRSNAEAWKDYDVWLGNHSAIMMEEPIGVETRLRALTRGREASPKEWADAYLAAFALASDLRMVTFDRALARKAHGAILLRR